MAVIDKIITYAKAAMTAAQRAAGATRVVAYNPTTSKLVYPDGSTAAAPSAAQVTWLQSSVSNQASVQRPWRWATFGDSRSTCFTTNTILAPTGANTALNDQRVPMWLVGMLRDSEIAASFGVAGDIVTSTSTTTGWCSTSRANSKTINNLIAASLFRGGPVDAVYVQHGINDYIAGTSAATVTTNIKALVSALMGAGFRVLLEATNPASAANYGASSATKLQATVDGNAILKAWAAGFPGQLAYADTYTALVDGTGFANLTYMPDGLHFNRAGAILSATVCAAAARTLLPAKTSLMYATGNPAQPNLIDWSGPTQFTSADIGSITITTPTWNNDTVTGMPYAECTMTCTALAGGFARARWEIHATTVSGATARFPLAIGDELQGSAYITADNGAGGVAQLQSIMVRHRLFSDSKLADVGSNPAAATTSLASPVAFLALTPTFVTATASSGISAPNNSAGYPLQVLAEFNTVGQVARIRVYAPCLRVVSSAQPTQPTAGASPYTYTNTSGAATMVYVAGGTVSALALSRQGTSRTIGATSGAYYLLPNDSITVTYTVAPTVTVQPLT